VVASAQSAPVANGRVKKDMDMDNRLLNSFAAGFAVAVAFIIGFVLVLTGITVASVGISLLGFVIVLASLIAYGLLLI
jgi:hypothetical protein